MKIKKINDDKLKILLSSSDLDEKNIDIDSFLANPIESQNLFFEILDIAEEKYDFEIENNRAIVEAISLDNNNLFVLTITKLKNDICTYSSNSKTYCFDNISDLLNFYSFIGADNVNLIKDDIYKYENKYYLLLNDEIKNIENCLLEFSYPIKNFSLLKDIFIEYQNQI